MKRKLLVGGLVALGLGLLGFLVATAGVVPLEASGGHFWVTEQLLQYGKHRSVATHARGVELPRLDLPWQVLKGAGHYEIGCRPCHGSPGFPPPPVATAMLPPPPDLADRVRYYSPAELFYVVKHGIKLTGMPAWPTQQRDDEVAAVVAFLLEWPELDRAGYEQLVYGDADRDAAVAPIEELGGKAASRAVIASCARCHGADGLSRGSPAFPVLAGQKEEYLAASLTAFTRGERHSGLMQPIAVALDDERLREVARHYASLPRPRPRPVEDAAAVERGRELARAGVPAAKVPACAQCHESAGGNHALYPRLDGQFAEYLVLQLELFAGEGRGGTEWSHLMDRAIHRLQPAQMRDVAAYYASAGE